MAAVKGVADAQFAPLKDLMAQYLESGEEVGASLTVNLDGKKVVDIWGGQGDNGQPWEQDTVVNVFSCSKTVTALAALVCVERGLLDVDSNVSKYWPEFAVNGKENVKVRHILSHSSGVPGWEGPITLEQVVDIPYATGRLEKQAPWWEPGTASGYHSFTFGHLVGELVRRVSGKPLARFIEEDLAAPLTADFQLGVNFRDDSRVASVIPPSPSPPAPANATPPDTNSIPYKVGTNPAFQAEQANSELWRRAALGAANGHGNARSMVRLLSIVTLGGEVDGVRLLSQKTINTIFREQSFGIDLAVGIPLRFGIGYGLAGKDTAVSWLPSGRVAYWGGFGGSMIIMDLDRKLTIGYAMNRMENVGLGSNRTKAYIAKVYEALNIS